MYCIGDYCIDCIVLVMVLYWSIIMTPQTSTTTCVDVPHIHVLFLKVIASSTSVIHPDDTY